MYKILALAGIVILGFAMKIFNKDYSGNKNLKVYHFYHNPYGYTCSEAERCIKEIVKESDKDLTFSSINTSEDNKDYIDGYHPTQKEVVIYNPNTEEYKVSSIRNLIKRGATDSEVKQQFTKELDSI
ncbi:MAG: hypothetical protein N4A44_00825 [Alphaproteobacteria bacterium]|jgi:hypothetical protein|nr:hypothetical protein [Alphaproteobacteria bacterium]